MSDALAAALLMQQRQQPQFDPASNSRRFAQMLMQQGSSTAPVQSWGEGLARALTGAAGGVFSGMAEREQQDKNRRLVEGLTGAMSEKDPTRRMEILKGLGESDTSGALIPFLGSMVSQQMSDERKNRALDTKLDAAGVGGGALPAPGQPGLGGPSGGPLTIDITPAPQGTPSASGFNNNAGNIRAGVGFPGEGPPQNGFATFATPQQGVNAMVQNLGAYLKQNPNMTVAQAISKWAPPNENNTQQYIGQVAEWTGINPGMPLGEVMKDPAVAAQLLDAITRKEKGGLPQGINADTFMAATGGQPQAVASTPQVAQGGEFQPTQVPAQSVPGGLPQMPASAPQPQPVTTMPEVSPAAQQLMQEAQRARAGGDRERSMALAQKAQEAQAAYVQERAKTADTRAYEQGQAADKRAYDAAEHDRQQMAVRGTEMEKLRTARAEGDAIITALRDYEKEFPKSGVRSVLGIATPANTAYNNAALLAKGEALFNLGVLNGPDLDIIRKTLPDPSTIAGWKTSDDEMRTAVGKVINLIETRISAKEKSLGVAPSKAPAQAPAAAAPQQASGAPQPGVVMDGYRFKGGDPSKQENWERAQ